MQYPFGILELLFARGLFFQIKLDPLRNRTDEKIVMDDGPQCSLRTLPTDGYACVRRERGRHAKSALSVSAAKGGAVYRQSIYSSLQTSGVRGCCSCATRGTNLEPQNFSTLRYYAFSHLHRLVRGAFRRSMPFLIRCWTGRPDGHADSRTEGDSARVERGVRVVCGPFCSDVNARSIASASAL